MSLLASLLVRFLLVSFFAKYPRSIGERGGAVGQQERRESGDSQSGGSQALVAAVARSCR